MPARSYEAQLSYQSVPTEYCPTDRDSTPTCMIDRDQLETMIGQSGGTDSSETTLIPKINNLETVVTPRNDLPAREPKRPRLVVDTPYNSHSYYPERREPQELSVAEGRYGFGYEYVNGIKWRIPYDQNGDYIFEHRQNMGPDPNYRSVQVVQPDTSSQVDEIIIRGPKALEAWRDAQVASYNSSPQSRNDKNQTLQTQEPAPTKEELPNGKVPLSEEAIQRRKKLIKWGACILIPLAYGPQIGENVNALTGNMIHKIPVLGSMMANKQSYNLNPIPFNSFGDY